MVIENREHDIIKCIGNNYIHCFVMCVCMCLCVCVRARTRVYMRVCVFMYMCACVIGGQLRRERRRARVLHGVPV